mmetsp:Transcript_10101/g.42447  ORF Transcript_10101/g.42447 Transcript_10101/m.42447 type:complete len:426 (-) Transcript_10101:645-1922(-)
MIRGKVFGGLGLRLVHSVVNAGTGKVPLKMWTEGLPVEGVARSQLKQTAALPIIHEKGIAVMPDCHWGIGATVGSVIPTKAAIIPAAVGVDLGCGMMAVRTSLKAVDMPDSLKTIRYAVERAIPHGRSSGGGRGDKGAWRGDEPAEVGLRFRNELFSDFTRIAAKHPRIAKGNLVNHLGTLGTGNHFVEMCLDETDSIWLMLHSGSRGVGNRIGMYFIELAKKDMRKHIRDLPNKDLAYFKAGSDHFDDYLYAVGWAQRFAKVNREVMMNSFLKALRESVPESLRGFRADLLAVDCHHNYVNREFHFGEDLLITRKGAVCAEKGRYGIIPGSMGAKSFIVQGKGNAESYNSCSHGAGRLMSRSEAKRRFSVEEHMRATRQVECRKDKDVIDETPMAYKPIDKVMAAQDDLVEIKHTLRQILCVKG